MNIIILWCCFLGSNFIFINCASKGRKFFFLDEHLVSSLNYYGDQEYKEYESVKDHYKCAMETCQGRGVCVYRLVETGGLYKQVKECVCVRKTYVGETCDIQPDYGCNSCNPRGSAMCFVYLGGADCYCHPRFYGVSCSTITEPPGWIPPSSISFYFNRVMKFNDIKIKAVMGYTTLKFDRLKIVFDQSRGFLYTDETKFEELSEGVTADDAKKAMSTLKSTTTIGQSHFVPLEFTLRYSGIHNIYVVADSRKIGEFQYIKIRDLAICQPEIRLVGPANPRNFKRTVILTNRWYKHRALRFVGCEGVGLQKTDVTVEFKYHLLETNQSFVSQEERWEKNENYTHLDEEDLEKKAQSILVEHSSMNIEWLEPPKMTQLFTIGVVATITETQLPFPSQTHVDIGWFDYYESYFVFHEYGMLFKSHLLAKLRFFITKRDDPYVRIDPNDYGLEFENIIKIHPYLEYENRYHTYDIKEDGTLHHVTANFTTKKKKDFFELEFTVFYFLNETLRDYYWTGWNVGCTWCQNIKHFDLYEYEPCFENVRNDGYFPADFNFSCCPWEYNNCDIFGIATSAGTCYLLQITYDRVPRKCPNWWIPHDLNVFSLRLDTLGNEVQAYKDKYAIYFGTWLPTTLEYWKKAKIICLRNCLSPIRSSKRPHRQFNPRHRWIVIKEQIVPYYRTEQMRWDPTRSVIGKNEISILEYRCIKNCEDYNFWDKKKDDAILRVQDYYDPKDYDIPRRVFAQPTEFYPYIGQPTKEEVINLAYTHACRFGVLFIYMKADSSLDFWLWDKKERNVHMFDMGYSCALSEKYYLQDYSNVFADTYTSKTGKYYFQIWKRQLELSPADEWRKDNAITTYTIEVPIDDHQLDTYTVMIYHNVQEIPISLGVMLHIGHSKRAHNLLLVNTARRLLIPFRVREDVLGNIDTFACRYKFYANFKDTEILFGTTALEKGILIEDIYLGQNRTNMPSVKFNLKHKEISAAIQKLHFMLVHRLYVRDNSFEVVHHTKKEIMNMILEALKQMTQIRLDNALEVFQIYTLAESILYAEPLPAKEEVLIAISDLLKEHSEKLAMELMHMEPMFYHAKRNTLRELIRPLIKSLEAIFFEPKVVQMENKEKESFEMDHIIRDLYDMGHIEESTKVVQEVDCKGAVETKKNTQGASALGIDAFESSMAAFMFTVRAYKYDGNIYQRLDTIEKPSHYYPPFNWYPKTVKERQNDVEFIEDDQPIVMFTVEAKAHLIPTYSLARMGFTRPEKAFATISDDILHGLESKEKLLQVQIALFYQNPLWSYVEPPKLLPTVFFMKIQDRKYQKLSSGELMMYHSIGKFLSKKFHKGKVTKGENLFTVHKTLYKQESYVPRNLMVLFKSGHPPIKVAIVEDRYPVETDFEYFGKVLGLSRKKRSIIKYNIRSTEETAVLYIAVKALVWDTHYEFILFGIQCVAFDRNNGTGKRFMDQQDVPEYMRNEYGYWAPHGRLEMFPEIDSKINIYDEPMVKCVAGSVQYEYHGVQVQRLKLQFLLSIKDMELKYSPATSHELLFLLLFLAVFFGSLTPYALLRDRYEDRRKECMYLVDNRTNEHYAYVLIIITGNLTKAGTTSNVGVKLFGTLGSSKRHILKSYNQYGTVFKKSSINVYILTTRKSLGTVTAFEMWTDYSGAQPSWFLEKLVVQDYRKQDGEWIFVVNEWFSALYGDQKLHRMIYQTKDKSLSFISRLLNPNVIKLWHIWFGMLYREPCHVMTRKIKILMAYTRSVVGSCVVMWFLGVVELYDEAHVDYGYFDFHEMARASVYASIIVAVTLYPIGFLYSNSRLRSATNVELFAFFHPTGSQSRVLHNYMFKNQVRLVVLCGYIAICFFGNLFVYTYSYSFGVRKSKMACFAVFLFIIHDAFYVETIRVVLRNLTWRVVMNREDKQDLCTTIVDIDYKDQIGSANRRTRHKLLRKPLYYPIGPLLQKIYHAKELIYQEYERYYKKFPIYVVLLGALIWFLGVYTDTTAYYSRSMIREMFEGEFTQTMGLSDVYDFKTLYDYINTTFIYVLQFQEPGITVLVNYKLLGLPRLRQLRILDSCGSRESYGYDDENCHLPLTEDIMETKHFNYYWLPSNLSRTDNVQSKTLIAAFQFNNFTALPLANKSLPSVVDGHVYPGGGYIAHLGRNWHNSRVLLDCLLRVRWLDGHTRVLFMELLLYNAFTNIYYPVQLAVEVKPTGQFYTEMHIESVKPFYKQADHTAGYDVTTIILLCAVIEYVSAILLNAWMQGDFRFHSLGTQVEFLIIITAVMTLYTFYIRMLLIPDLMRLVETSSPYQYIGIDPVVLINRNFRMYSAMLLGLLITRLTTIAFRLSETMRVTQILHQLYIKPIISVILFTLTLFLLFEIIFHFIFSPFYSMYQFTNVVPLLGRLCQFIIGIIHPTLHYTTLMTTPHKFTIIMITICLLIICIKFILISLFTIILAKILIKSYIYYRYQVKHNRHLCNVCTFIRERLIKDKKYIFHLRNLTLEYAVKELDKLVRFKDYEDRYQNYILSLFLIKEQKLRELKQNAAFHLDNPILKDDKPTSYGDKPIQSRNIQSDDKNVYTIFHTKKQRTHYSKPLFQSKDNK